MRGVGKTGMLKNVGKSIIGNLKMQPVIGNFTSNRLTDNRITENATK